MNNELLIGVGGLVLSVLTYFAGVWRTERRHRAEDKETRIRRVFERYMDLRSTNQTGGLDGLQKSGISTLASNDEIGELFNLIVSHGERHPLGSSRDSEFSGVDLWKFFKYASDHQVNFFRSPIEKIVNASGAKA